MLAAVTGPSMTIVVTTALPGRTIERATQLLSAAGSHEAIDAIDVVVVDTSATPDPVHAAASAVRVILAPGATPGRARNLGIDAARGDRVWLLDERAIAVRATAERHLAATGIVIGRCDVPTGDPDGFDVDWWYEHRHHWMSEAAEARAARDCSFANASAPTALLRAHPFDEGIAMRGIDDVELGQRLLDDGRRIAYDDAVSVLVDTTAGQPDAPDARTGATQRGADVVRFLRAHPDAHHAVLRANPGRFDRTIRRMTERAGTIDRLGLRIAAVAADALAIVPVATVRRHAREIAASCRQHAVLASTPDAAGRDEVAAAMRASVAGTRPPQSRAQRWVRERFADPARAATLRWRIHHVHGPTRIERAPDDVLVVTTVRNGIFYARSFLDHHRRLGIRHFLVLDNGSDDGTLELFTAQPDVTVYRTGVPYKSYENLLKRHMVRAHSAGKWNLFVDIDELFDYPGSDRMGLTDLVGYLEAQRATAVVTQMLDLFSSDPLADTPGEVDDLLTAFPWFDLSDISKRPYEFDANPESPLRSHHGGIRRTIFGSDNGLTKAALTFVDDEIELFVGWHHARNARMADIACVLLHFPFNRAFAAKAEEAARTGRYGLGASHEYRAYWARLADEPSLSLRRETATRYDGVDQLVDLELLHVSPAYRQWVADHSRTAE